jgi:hypothetical protein
VSKDSHQLDGGRCLPTSRSYAAGFRSSSELSSLSGVRHFWQYMAGNTHSQREESLVVDDVVLMSLSFEIYRCWVHFNASDRAGACRSQRHWRAPAAEQSPGHSEGDACPPRRIVMCARLVRALPQPGKRQPGTLSQGNQPPTCQLHQSTTTSLRTHSGYPAFPALYHSCRVSELRVSDRDTDREVTYRT